MKTTLMPLHAAATCAVAPHAVLLQGTGVSAALRFRTDVDVTAAAADAAPPPRGAPV